MPRKARVVVPSVAHHVIQRGNYQQYIFEKDEDYRLYLYLMKQNAEKYAVIVHAYCLMGNHVHFIVTPSDTKGLSELFKIVHLRYSQYKNVERRRMGHLWQGRFYSCILGDTHLLRAVRYVEMNPVRAKIVRDPWQYLWSSARQHLNMEKSPIVKTSIHGACEENGICKSTWKEYLCQQDNAMIKEMRSKTQKGLAVGTINFIMGMENKLGIVLRERKPGRSKKEIK